MGWTDLASYAAGLGAVLLGLAWLDHRYLGTPFRRAMVRETLIVILPMLLGFLLSMRSGW